MQDTRIRSLDAFQVPIERRYPFMSRLKDKGGRLSMTELDFENLSASRDFGSALEDGLVTYDSGSGWGDTYTVRFTAKGRWLLGIPSKLDRLIGRIAENIRRIINA